MNGFRDLPDLVDEQRSSVGKFEAARLLTVGSGKGPLFVTEQFALHQGLWDGGRVHDHKGVFPAGALLVQPVGEKLLADSRFAHDQHGAVGTGDVIQLGQDLQHLWVLGYDLPGIGLPESCQAQRGPLLHLLVESHQVVNIDRQRLGDSNQVRKLKGVETLPHVRIVMVEDTLDPSLHLEGGAEHGPDPGG